MQNDINQISIEQVSTPEGFRVIKVKGWITTANQPALEKAIEQARGLVAILDLSEVPYMDSSGLGAVLGGYVAAQKYGGQFVLAGVSPRVVELFKLTKVHSLFKIYANVKEATQVMAKGASA